MTSDSATSKFERFGGWLLLFWVLTLVKLVTSMAFVLDAFTRDPGTSPALPVLPILVKDAMSGLVAFVILRVVRRRSPDALSQLFACLHCYLGVLVISYAWVWLGGIPWSDLRDPATSEAGYFLIWWNYLGRAERVKAYFQVDDIGACRTPHPDWYKRMIILCFIPMMVLVLLHVMLGG